jgi:hypothetical protein
MECLLDVTVLVESFTRTSVFLSHTSREHILYSTVAVTNSKAQETLTNISDSWPLPSRPAVFFLFSGIECYLRQFLLL